jgi:hypothetical protein
VPTESTVSRNRAVQGLLNLFADPSYLEIGVNEGATFTKVKASRKVAVDPVFLFDVREAGAADPASEFHEITSDDYFGRVVDPDERFDVIYLDGLHTFEQTLRDFTNAVHHLSPKGVILIDDVCPVSYLASLPDRDNYFTVRNFLEVTDKSWMGDVYRLVFFVETFYQHMSYATIADNHGQAVIWRERRSEVPLRTVRGTGELTFEEFVLGQEHMRLMPYDEILERIRPSVGSKEGRPKKAARPAEVTAPDRPGRGQRRWRRAHKG